MSQNAWLTKNSIPSGRVSYVLTLPDDEAWRADFLGAFLLLTQEENWEQFETLTPTEMADEWLELFLDFESEFIPMIPPGTVSAYAGASAPDGWLLCNGQAVSRTTYAALFAVVDLIYGFGDGSTTFNVPNLVGNVVVGRDASQAGFDFLGEPGGEKEHTLTSAEMPVHTHVQNGHNHVQDSHNHIQNSHGHAIFGDLFAATGTAQRKPNVATGGADVNSGSSTATNQATTATNQANIATNQNTGSGNAHNNMPPYLVLNYIIKT